MLAAMVAAGRMAHGEWVGWAKNAAGRLSASVGFAGVSVELARGTEEAPPHLFALARTVPPKSWDAPLIVAVDEAQRLPPGTHSPQALFFQAIHDASSGLPLTLVLAGLGDTLYRAQEMGLTRGIKQHEVGQLEAEDIRTLMTRFCRRFGLRASGCAERLAELAAPAEGWPRHLHLTLQALSEEALAADGDLEKTDWKRTAAHAAGSRLQYYRAQQSREMKASRRLVGAVMRKLSDDMKCDDIVWLIEECAADVPGFRLPNVMDSEDFCRHLVHQGALEQRIDDSYRCPIPSFRSFLIKEGADPGRSPVLSKV